MDPVDDQWDLPIFTNDQWDFLEKESPQVDNQWDLPMFTNDQWDFLEKESHQVDVQTADFSSLEPYDELQSFSDLDLGWLENETPEKDVHNSDFHSVGADNQVQSGAENDGLQGIGVVSHVADPPEGKESLLCGQIPQASDHAAEGGDLAVGVVCKDPLDDDDQSISSSCMPVCPEQDWVPPENDLNQNDVQVSDLHPLGADRDADSGAQNDEIEGIELVLHAPNKPEETQVSAQISEEPDHACKDGDFTAGIEGIGVVLNEPNQPEESQVSAQISEEPDHACKDGDLTAGIEVIGDVPQVPDQLEGSGAVVSAPEASSSVGKRRGRPPKRPELAPSIQEQAPQIVPTQQSSQHLESSRGTSGLPDGWTTQVTVRRKGFSKGHKDKFYIEESTNKRCRSIPDVWKYIEKKRRLEGETGANVTEAPTSTSSEPPN